MTQAFFVPFILAMFPIAERYAISVAILNYHLSLTASYIIVLTGNMLPVVAIVFLLGPLTDLFSKYSKTFKKVFETVCNYSRKKNAKTFERLKELSLVIIAALPIPLMGTWSGALAAFIFDIPPAKSIPLILIGAIISNTLVVLAAKGITLIF